MSNNDNIFGSFISITEPNPDASQAIKDLALKHKQLFLSYILIEGGLFNKLKALKYDAYGKDLKLVLFQFYVNPLPIELQYLKEIEGYRKSEKAIGIPIVINNENFFSKSEEGRNLFLKNSFLKKLDLLEEIVKRKKLDTNKKKLISDVQLTFSN